MLRAAAGGQGLRWRAWPCPKCNSGITAIGAIIGGPESSPPIRGDDPDELAKAQVALLLAWVGRCEHHPEYWITVPKLAEGSEHEVFINGPQGCVYKVTRPGIFGESYYLVDGRVNQRNCSPLEYLVRLRLWGKVFRSAPLELGITPEGRIVSRQKFIAGDPPEQEQVEQFLLSSGLEEVKRQCFLWKKAYPDFDVWLGDARDENFVLTPRGIVPIDLRMWFA